VFISFEGIDGSGKSTQVALFREYLERNSMEYVFIREPGGTQAGEDIREILLHNEYKLFPETELLLFMASRAQIVREVIIPALKKKKLVLADRFLDSSVAYQGYGRGLSIQMVTTLNEFSTGGVTPHLTLFIDVPVDVAVKRMRREMKHDKIEMESLDFFKRVRQGYLELAKRDPKRILVIDGTMSVEKIHEQVVKEFLLCLKKLGHGL